MHPVRSLLKDGPSRSGLIVAIALTIGALLLLSQLQTNAEYEPYLPESDPYVQDLRAVSSQFAGAEFVTITVESDTPFSKATMEKVRHITAELEALEPVASAFSLTTVEDVPPDGSSAPQDGGMLIDLEDYSPEETRARVMGTDLYRSVFLTRNSDGLVIYLVPRDDVTAPTVATSVLNHPLVANDPDVFSYGEPILSYLTAQTVFDELFMLGAAVLAVIFVLATLLYRRIVIALVITGAGLLPGLWVLALFPMLGLEVGILTTMAPVMTVILSTTYAIHVIRRYRFRSMSEGELRRDVGPIVGAAAGTTATGMLSLLLTPFPELRLLAVLVVAGVALAGLFALYVIPAFAGSLRFRQTPFWDSFEEWVPSVQAARGRRIAVAAVLGALIVLALVGMPRITADHRLSDIVRRGSELWKRIDRYWESSGGTEQIQLVIETNREYGLVEPATYRGLVEVHREIEQNENVSQTISVVPFVGWINGRLEGTRDSVQPETAATIGESLEMLASGTEAVSLDSLVDPNWQRARFLIRHGDPTMSTREATRRFQELEQSIRTAVSEHLPQAESHLFGAAIRSQRNVQYHREGMVTSVMVFLGIVGLLVAIAFRSVRWMAIVLLPTTIAVIVYFGLLGWLTIPLAPVSMFTVALLLGVGNDDVLYFSMTFRTVAQRRKRDEALKETFNHSGAAIVQTTLLILGGCSMLLLSSYERLSSAALLFAGSLVLCTIITLSAIPRLLYNSPVHRKPSEGEYAR